MRATRIPLVLGCGSMGHQESGARVSDATVLQQMVDIMVDHGQTGVDTARIYNEGTSEKIISSIDLRGARVDTKVFPVNPGDHSPEKLKVLFRTSKEVLGSHKIRTLFLHAPDRATPFARTLKAVNDLYKAGEIEQLGLCNFPVPDVIEILDICKRCSFLKPAVFQGPYNPIDRVFEAKLFPILRENGIKFAAHSPLAGGFLTGKLLGSSNGDQPALSHFDPKWIHAHYYTDRYVPMTAAVSEVQAVAAKHGLTLAEVTYRWLQWHSALVPEDHGLVIGPSSLTQLESTISDCEKQGLPEEVVSACEEAWSKVKDIAKETW